MIAADASTAQLNHFRTQAFIWSEIKFLCAVIPNMPAGGDSGLHTIGAHDLPGGFVHHDQVVAYGVELIGVHAGEKWGFKAPLRLQIKNPKTQAAGGSNFFPASCQAHLVFTGILQLQTRLDFGNRGLDPAPCLDFAARGHTHAVNSYVRAWNPN